MSKQVMWCFLLIFFGIWTRPIKSVRLKMSIQDTLFIGEQSYYDEYCYLCTHLAGNFMSGQGRDPTMYSYAGLDWSQGLQFLYRSTCCVQYLDSWRVNLSHLTWPVQIWSSSVIKVPPTKLTIVDELCRCSLCIIW